MSDLLRVVERAADNPLLAEEFLARESLGDGGEDPASPPRAGPAHAAAFQTRPRSCAAARLKIRTWPSFSLWRAIWVRTFSNSQPSRAQRVEALLELLAVQLLLLAPEEAVRDDVGDVLVVRHARSLRPARGRCQRTRFPRLMRRIALGAVLLLGLLPGVALAAFPGTNPDESVRLNTPNDPDYDPCEADNEGGATCSSVFEEDYERFGFAPDLDAEHRALQEPRGDRAPAGAEHARRAQPARADPRRVRRPRVEALDRPARRGDRDPRHRHPLGRGLAAAEGRAQRGRAADAAVRRGRLQRRRRVRRRRLRRRPARLRDRRARRGRRHPRRLRPARRVLATATDEDANGYADDIAGWDFFDDDNDPYDASSYASASNHGTGRAQEAGQLDERRRGRDEPVPALPDRAAAGVGHVRDRHEHVRARAACTRPTTGSRSSRRRSAGSATRASRARSCATPTRAASSSRWCPPTSTPPTTTSRPPTTSR